MLIDKVSSEEPKSEGSYGKNQSEDFRISIHIKAKYVVVSVLIVMFPQKSKNSKNNSREREPKKEFTNGKHH